MVTSRLSPMHQVFHHSCFRADLFAFFCCDIPALPWQVTSLLGACGETVPLHPPLLTSRIPQSWLSSLELAIRHNMAVCLHRCVVSRLWLDKTILCCHGNQEASSSSEARQKLVNWLEEFPSETVVVTEAIMQCREIADALESAESERKASLECVR